MLLHELICEDYKTAAVKFNAVADPTQVQQVIAQYRQLVNRNQVQGQERNIDYWAKQGWEKFSQFVQSKSSTPTVTQIKRKQAAGKSIILSENDKWLIVIPLDHDASCYHGRNTEWCTARPNRGHFDHYFLDNEVVLIYCLDKQTGNKWAIAMHKNLSIAEYEYFDKNDISIDSREFQQQTGLDPKKLIEMVPHSDTRIADVRQQRKDLIALVKTRFQEWEDRDTFLRDMDLERLLAQTKLPRHCTTYIKVVGIRHGPQEYTGAVAQTIIWAAVNQDGQDGSIIRYIKNPSEAVQLAAVKHARYGDAIKYIENPSEAVQLAAVNENADSIRFIENPSEAAQIATVEQDGYAIRFLKDPSEAVQMAAVNRNGMVIHYIKNPSEAVQMAAVKQDGNTIRYIENPSEAVQLAAVKLDGSDIEYIKNPSEIVQMIAVKQNASVIKYIRNPTEAVQLAAIKQYAGNIYHIQNPTPKAIELASSKK